MQGGTSRPALSLSELHRQQLEDHRNLLHSGSLTYAKETELRKAAANIEAEALEKLKQAHLECQTIWTQKAEWNHHFCTKDNYHSDVQPTLISQTEAQARYGMHLSELQAFLEACPENSNLEHTWTQLAQRLAEIEALYKSLIYPPKKD